MSAAAASTKTPAGIFAGHDFRLYLAAVFLNTVGVQIQSVAVGWQIYDLVRNPLALGYVGLAQFLPILAFCLPAGSLADRFNRRAILTISFATQMLVAAGFLILTLGHPGPLWPFYLILCLFGSARAFAGPAAQSFLPLLVPQEQFPQAVAWNSSTGKVGVILGPALGGAIYLLGPVVAYSICLILFAGVTIAIACLRTQSEARPVPPGSSTLERLLAGIFYVRSKSIILGTISLDLFAVLLGGATALLPVYARDILHVGPSGLGLLRSAPALGAAIVGIILGRRPLDRHCGNVMFVGVAIFGVATIVFGLSTNFAVSLAALTVLGASDMVSVYVRATLVQLATPDPMRGRVSAVNRLFISASNEFGEFESGVTAAWLGTVPSVMLGGIGTLVVVALWWGLFPSLRAIDRLTDIEPEQ